MQLREFKRESRTEAYTAAIVSDGCRDYFVEVRHKNSIHLLRDGTDRPLHFRSLSEAQHAAKGAVEIRLVVRVAAAEACADAITDNRAFSSQVLYRKNA